MGSVMTTTIREGNCRSKARIWCKNCSISCGRHADGGYIVGESKLGMTTLWIEVGGELFSLVVMSLMNRRNGDCVGSMPPPRVV